MSWQKGMQARDWSYKDLVIEKYPEAVCIKRSFGYNNISSINGYVLYLTKEDKKTIGL